MTESTVTGPLPQREPGAALRKTIGEMQPGDWIARGELDVDEPVEIRYVEIYHDDYDVPCCRGLYRRPSTPAPFDFDLSSSTPFRMATALDIETAHRAQQRGRIGAKLRALSDLVAQDGFPVGDPFDAVRVTIPLVNVADLERVAAAIGGTVRTDGLDSFVEWPVAGAGDSPVQAIWKAYSPAVVADPLGTARDEAKFSDNPWTRAAAQAVDDEDNGFGYSREPESFVGSAAVPSYVQGESMTGREPQCTPECDALQGEANQAITGLARTWHANGCPVPVHHHAADGVTACGEALSNLPPAHGFETGGWDITDCKSCLAARRIPSIDPDASMEAHYDAEVEAR
jgi:hypothetical protein